MSYELRLTPAAERDLKALPQEMRVQVVRQLRALSEDPRPPGAIALKGWPHGSYRVRVGDCRIGYEIDDKAHLVKTWQIGDRKRFYQKAKRRR